MLDFWGLLDAPSKPPVQSDDGVEDQDGVENKEAESSESDLDAVDFMHILEKKRLSLDVAGDQVADGFHWVLKGGAWLDKANGIRYEYAEGKARAGAAEKFCDNYGFKKSHGFSLSLYGQDGAKTLAKAWCHKLNFFYSLHAINAVAEPFAFTEEDIRSYIEPADLTELAACDHAATLQRIAQLRELSPKHK